MASTASERRRRPAPPEAGRRPAPAALVALSALVACLFATPLAYLAIRGLDEGGTVAAAWASGATLGPLARTLALGVSVAGASAVLGTALAWLVARTDLPGRRTARLLLPLPLVMPSFIAAFALLAAFAPGGLLAGLLEPLGVERLPAFEGFWGALYVLTLFTYPYVYLPVAARLGQLPASLEESARLLGRSPAAVFRTVVAPQAAGAVWAGTLLVFLYTISDFGAVQLLRYQTLTSSIYASRVFDRTAALAQSLLLGLLAVAVVTAERSATRGGSPGRLAAGRRSLRVPLGRWRAPALALVAGVIGLALAAPVGVLAFWAVRGLLAGSARAGALVADTGGLVVPAVNTAALAVVAALVAVAAVLPLAYLTARHSSRLAGAANAVVVGGFALPGLVVALALAFWTLQAPWPLAALYQTQALLVFAYVIHFGSQALRAGQVAVAAVPGRLDDAARTLGAGRLRRLRTVELPLAAPGLLAGAGLVLLSTMKELPATLLLAPPGFETLATRIWNATEDAFLADASLAALFLLLLSGVLTWFLVVRRGDAPT
ncbi:MAG TPA: iron ABC transporter permease [Actinomycetota bacterium]|nr:iron ABC transporter permease [Actinomycetota bacterium]